MTPRRKPFGCTFSPTVRLHRLRTLVDDQGDVARPLEDLGGTAVRPAEKALRRRTFVDERALHVEAADDVALGALPLADPGAQRLLPEPPPPPGGGLRKAPRLLHGLATRQVHHPA